MQRGLYGRAESPYNSKYLTGAFASGSSNGSATATAASFGAFGMCEEKVSSGRSSASNNALVAYTPSRGIISIRGNWPLFPSCDTVVPHTRTVTDMFDLLDVIVQQDDIREGDFWREQQHVPLPDVHEIRPSTYHELADTESLQGMYIGVPRMYIGGKDPEGEEVTTRQSVINLWNSARSHLESLGATVTEVDFPVVTNYEKVDWTQGSALRNKIEITKLMAYAWDDFLIGNKDPSCPSLSSANNAMIFPVPQIPDKYNPADPLGQLLDVIGMMKDRIPTHEFPGLKKLFLHSKIPGRPILRIGWMKMISISLYGQQMEMWGELTRTSTKSPPYTHGRMVSNTQTEIVLFVTLEFRQFQFQWAS